MPIWGVKGRFPILAYPEKMILLLIWHKMWGSRQSKKKAVCVWVVFAPPPKIVTWALLVIFLIHYLYRSVSRSFITIAILYVLLFERLSREQLHINVSVLFVSCILHKSAKRFQSVQNALQKK